MKKHKQIKQMLAEIAYPGLCAYIYASAYAYAYAYAYANANANAYAYTNAYAYAYTYAYANANANAGKPSNISIELRDFILEMATVKFELQYMIKGGR
jgi:hypothetical protein